MKLPHPADGYPVSVLAQCVYDGSELAADTFQVLPHKHSVDQVPKVLVDEGSRGGHLLLLLILQGKRRYVVWGMLPCQSPSLVNVPSGCLCPVYNLNCEHNSGV